MEESKPNYQLEEVEIGGRKLLKDPFTGTIIFETPEAKFYFSPEGKIIDKKSKYVPIDVHPRPRILTTLKTEPVVHELLRYEMDGFSAVNQNQGAVRNHGLTIAAFIRNALTEDPKRAFSHEIQKSLWGELAEKTILNCFETYRNDCFTKVDPYSGLLVCTDAGTIANLLNDNLKAIFLHPDEEIDIANPVYFFRLLDYQVQNLGDKIKPKLLPPPLKSDYLALPPNFE